MNLRLGPISRVFAPGFSTCMRCGTPWRFVTPHTTMFTPQRGCFPLCEKCWAELTVEDRLPFYERWVASVDKGPAVRDALMEAVRSEGET